MLARFVGNNQVGKGAPRWFAVTAACFTLAATTLAGGVLAQENLGAPSPPAGYQAPLHQLNLANPEPASAAPQAKKEGLAPFFADAKFGGQLKTYYLNRDKFTPDRSQAWALGGSLSALSGYLGPVRFGAVGYTSQKLYGPDDQDGTRFRNPCGHDVPGHVSTARDLAQLTEIALRQPEFARMVATIETEIRTTDGSAGYPLRATNLMPGRYEGAAGVETGYTPGAGKCLIALAQRKTTRALLVLLNAPDRWWDTEAMLDRAFAEAGP